MPTSQRPVQGAPTPSDTQSTSQRNDAPPIPPQILQQADNAAAAAAATTTDTKGNRSELEVEPPVEEVPPPPYSANQYGEIDINEKGIDTGARVAEDGRVDIKISSQNRRLTSLLRHQLELGDDRPPTPEPEIPDGLGYVSGLPPPPMNIVIQIVGSRGDVQPFVALGLVLKNNFNHRVRIATHPVFKDFITENGLEFFSIGGDPAELMAFMVKNPGLMPGIEAIRSGDIGKRRKGIYEMINGCWRSCIEPGDGTGAPASDDVLEGRSTDSGISMGDSTAKPFVADAIIANPPSFAHLHIAEKLGIPLHLMFTMPWSPTQSFPHPLANIVSSNTDAAMTNFLSYILVDLLTWQGIGDVINRFREKTLKLEPLSVIWAPGNLHRLKIPWTYCWSPALIPKPSDWRSNIDISGFYFLNLASNYVPPPDLDEFLRAGPPPVYIGFGSIVVDDPNAMTKLIFEAVQKTGQRALVSKGWGGLSGDEMGVPEGVFMLGNCPHDWLFKKVSCVVHHGGAGTTAAGIAAGRPTIIVPFFGDQPFWGQMCHRAGAGPEPIPHKELTADKLAEAIDYALKPEVLDRAQEMCEKIKQEKGSDAGADSFHRHLSISKLRCDICPGRVAVWQYRKSGVKLSALAATVLANENLLDFADLRLFRAREYVVDTGPPEPISGGAAALIGTIGAFGAGVADYPAEILKSFKKGSTSNKGGENEGDTSGPSTLASPSATGSASESTNESTTNLSAGLPSLSTASTRSEMSATSQMSRETPSASIVVTDADKDNANRRSYDTARNNSVGAMTPPLVASPSASTTSLRPDESPRHSRGSMSHSRSGSGASTPKGQERSPSYGRAQQITMDSMIGSAKATGNIVAAGMKSPLDFTMSIAQGFHNAPKLYGDKTVRPAERVTGFHSGLKAAGKEFGYGMYDGISGLVTQPLQGAREEGLVGFGKGLLKGGMGVWLKPGAAIWGLPGYTMKGIYAEIVKNFGKSTSNFIIAARTAQGYEDWKGSSEGERERIVAAWKSDAMQAKANSKKWCNKPKQQKTNAGKDKRFYDSQGQLLKGFSATKHLSYEERKELHKLRKAEKEKEKGKSKTQSGEADEATLDNTSQTESPISMRGSADDELEQAIRTAVQRTSQNNPEEDARIERAIRASVREFQRNMSTNSATSNRNDNGDDVYNRAVAASVAEYQRSPRQSTEQESGTITATLRTHEDDEQLMKALAASLQESRRDQARSQTRDEGLGSDTEDDEDYRRTIEASRNVQSTSSQGHNDDEEYRRVLEESKQAHYLSPRMRPTSFAAASSNDQPPRYSQVSASSTDQTQIPTKAHIQEPTTQTGTRQSTQTAAPWQQALSEHETEEHKDDDEEIERVLKASKEEAQKREAELERQRKDEETVLEYVKRQSLAEEEYRRKMQGGQ